jgi:hypothetical protein
MIDFSATKLYTSRFPKTGSRILQENTVFQCSGEGRLGKLLATWQRKLLAFMAKVFGWVDHNLVEDRLAK